MPLRTVMPMDLRALAPAPLARTTLCLTGSSGKTLIDEMRGGLRHAPGV